jgi:sec-independent protein translocase protein TatB
MNFFGIGPLEIGLVVVIAVVVLGPERFPELAVQIARAIKYLRGYANEATSDLRAEFQELTKEYEEMRKELAEVRSSVASGATGLMKDVTAVSDDMRRAAGEAQPKLPKMRDLLGDTKPIIEPGGDLPPERNGSNGASH